MIPRQLRIGALVLFLIILLLQGITYIASIEKFKITQIMFTGNEYLSEDYLHQYTQMLLGRSLLLTSHKQVVSLLSPVTHIADFKMVKRYPHVLEIKIMERMPLGKVVLFDKTIIFDKDGVILNEGQIHYGEFVSVPLIKGLSSLGDIKQTMTIMGAFLKKINHFTKTDAVVLDISNQMNYVLYINAIPVKLGTEQYVMSKANVLEALYPIIKTKSNSIVYVDLRSPQNAVIRYNR